MSIAESNRSRRGTGKGIAFLKALIGHTGTDCVIWPFSRTEKGYASVCVNGKCRKAHRLLCIMAHGEPPTPEHEAAHSCGNGHAGCVNPFHLSWKTRIENQRDRYVHKRLPPKRGKHKLTPEQVIEIRAIGESKTRVELAEQFGVSPDNIRQILVGETWSGSWLDKALTPDQVRAIRADSGTGQEIADRHGVGLSTVYFIRQGRSYRHVPDVEHPSAITQVEDQS
jgi:hypothetical protein